jgi:hypothetical protein
MWTMRDKLHEMSTMTQNLPKPIKGKGLTVPGVVILQFLLIFLIESLEFAITKVGLMTGIALLLAFFGGIYLGRSGTSLASAVNPPIAFFLSTVIDIALLGGASLQISKIGLDLVTSLAGVAPYLVIGAVLAWISHFIKSRQK